MGYDLELFTAEVSDDFVCSICNGVYEDPVMINSCEHIFCRRCVMEWLKIRRQCPMDRAPLNTLQLKPVPRIVRSMLAALEMNCEFAPHGCKTSRLKIEAYGDHTETCAFRNGPPEPEATGEGDFSEESGFAGDSNETDLSRPGTSASFNSTGSAASHDTASGSSADHVIYVVLVLTVSILVINMAWLSLVYFSVTMTILKITFIAAVFRIVFISLREQRPLGAGNG